MKQMHTKCFFELVSPLLFECQNQTLVWTYSYPPLTELKIIPSISNSSVFYQFLRVKLNARIMKNIKMEYSQQLFGY